MPKPEKVRTVEVITEAFQGSQVYYFLDFRGLTVGESTDLRHRLRGAGASLKVVKNTLAQIAAREAGVDGLETLLEGPTAIAFCHDDPVKVAKVIQDFIKEKKKLVIRGGRLERSNIGAQQVEALASMPGREQLLARLAGAIAMPLYGLAGAMSGPLRGMAMVLEQVRQQKAEAA